MATIKFETLDEETCEIEVELPARYEVCSRCRGEGKHDHPAFSNGFSREDLDEDSDFAEGYFRGDYDVVCEQCQGRTTVLVVDADACKAQGLEKELEAYFQHRREIREVDLMTQAERRMGA
jgi:RecJ-like exonuclease